MTSGLSVAPLLCFASSSYKIPCPCYEFLFLIGNQHHCVTSVTSDESRLVYGYNWSWAMVSLTRLCCRSCSLSRQPFSPIGSSLRSHASIDIDALPSPCTAETADLTKHRASIVYHSVGA